MKHLGIEDAHAGYTKTDVLRGVTISVQPGECLAVLGPNGAGKSTLFRAISGQLRLRQGRRIKDDEDVTAWRAYKLARAGVRWVGEPRPVFPTLTVEQNLAVGGITRRDIIKEQTEEVFTLLPMLREKQRDRAASLSGGQQQMLAIGQALMTRPEYLCLDEPSLGLAPAVVTNVAGLVTTLASRGVGVLWAEQFPDLALARSSHVLLMSAGRALYAGPVAGFDRGLLEAAYLGKRISAA